MNWKIEDKLFKCKQIALEKHFSYMWAYNALEWYITTGRANSEFLNKFLKCYPKALINNIGGKTMSDNDYIDRIFKYFKLERHI